MTTKKFRDTRDKMMGSFFLSSGGTDCVVIDYRSCYEVTVMFLDKYEHTITTGAATLRKNNVFNPYEPTVYGVGYIGFGKHRAREVPEHHKKTKAYEVWRDMIKRCYSEKSLILNPSYRGCTVCEEWLDFQVFAEWYINHEFYGFGYQLDKDILISGNREYSPTACSLVPREINCLFNINRKTRGKYPIGVSESKGSYLVQLSVEGKNQRLGRYKTPEEAYIVYKEAKEKQVKNVALQNRLVIEDSVFKALMCWKLENTDEHQQ